jgi:superfamily II RNA helicase
MVKVCSSIYPKESNYNEYFDKFPYSLSSFQKHAIESIVEGHHVLVTAHTGSGKTLPAEFAIKHFTSNNKKVIYTSPIKALSNQKYYEFTQKFPDISIGLFTGDIKTNPEADVLIMTTEILMNSLFNRANNSNQANSTNMSFQIDFDNELAAVVFDEVHYINDEHRGQVWEKCIMMLPEHVQKIMLSATIDNPKRFAEWCESIYPESKRIVYLSTTKTRVVPLSHYCFMVVGDANSKKIKNKEIQKFIRTHTHTLIQIQNDKGAFDSTNSGYNTIMALQKYIREFRFVISRKFVLNQLVSFLKENSMLPAIVFVFSRKKVESYARDITVPLLEDDSKQPYVVQRECDAIIRKLPNGSEYLQLPEYIELVKLLEKGIAIHHSGMIPILREIVELCISKKYVKLLFATESFAVGLDCPIKTVVFSSLTKFDGNTERFLEPHEYTQMAGRAGRRGIDVVGHVVHCNNMFDLPDRGSYFNLLQGKSPSLNSKFKIAYDLVLNIIKTNSEDSEIKTRQFIEKSMLQVELTCQINAYRTKIESSKDTIIWDKLTPIDICQQYMDLTQKEYQFVNKQRKQIQTKLKNIEDTHILVKNDVAYWKDHVRKKTEYLSDIDHKANLERSVSETVNNVFTFLKSIQFIKYDDDEMKWELTHLGTISSSISEINPLIWTKCMVDKWNYFKDFTVYQIVGLLSCTTDIKVSSNMKMSIPNTNDNFLQSKILEMNNINTEFIHLGKNIGTRNEEYEFVYDIIDDTIEWCNCTSEDECKLFMQTNLVAKGISVGDFTKAMLKIATISRELITLGTLEICKPHVEWINKLSQIEGLVLKYIVTNQSLYV